MQGFRPSFADVRRIAHGTFAKLVISVGGAQAGANCNAIFVVPFLSLLCNIAGVFSHGDPKNLSLRVVFHQMLLDGDCSTNHNQTTGVHPMLFW